MPAANRENFFGAWPRANGERDISPPNVINTNIFPRTFPSSPQCTPFNNRYNSPQSLPSSPLSTSPPSVSPPSTLRRNYSSTFTLIPEDRELDIRVNTAEAQQANDNLPLLVRLIFWWPHLLIKIGQNLIGAMWRITWGPIMLASPTFIVSVWLWIFWKIICWPFAIVKFFITLLHTPASERWRNKRTVLISSGSTIQTLHLARNFYSAGARVVVFEFDGYFGLSRFSTAVSKYYTIPKPKPEAVNEYVDALCNIVAKEHATFYIPVSATNAAYYDAIAKPHLELLGCSSFIPGTQEITVLDDIYELMKKCHENGLAIPAHRVINGKDELKRLYDSGWLDGYQNQMISTGSANITDRMKIILPPNFNNVRLMKQMEQCRSWLVIRHPVGSHYVCCATIKDSRVISNVTCLVQDQTHCLIPDENAEINQWLEVFFSKVRFQRSITGHVSFRFAQCQKNGGVIPLGSRVGVSLPYICHTSAYPRILWKPCPHFSRTNSRSFVCANTERYWMPEIVLNTLKHPSVDAVGKLIGTILDQREALFVFWDPLPYCAYYHIQFPFRSLKKFLHQRQLTKS